MSSRLMTHLSADLVPDGGQWDMAVNIWERYGIVPQALYPDSFHSALSAPFNLLLKSKIRDHANSLRKAAKILRSQGLDDTELIRVLRSKKEEMMAELYRIITSLLGPPPKVDEKFSWDYVDKDGKAGHWEGTPIEFYKTFIGSEVRGNLICFSFSF
jgi:bleomycin hydrolase